MSRFNGLLDAIFLPPRNWVLNNALKFVADLNEVEISKLARCGVAVKDNGEVTVPAGYITDLASVPRIAWAVIAPFDVARAAVVHDILYEKINGAFKEGTIKSKSEREEYRAIADNIFRQGMEYAEPSVSKFKILSAYYAVRMFGRWAINSSAPRGAKPKK
tara:strand:+ start:3091 stop:3573 length:483 start_codon:yes stop_codon:yes gene_type:complete